MLMSSKVETMSTKSTRTLTPKLRFPEFLDSEGWQTPQLSDLYGFKRTNTLSRDKLNYEAGKIRNIHYGDIHTKFNPLFRLDQEAVPFINPEVSVSTFEEENDCEEGDIVLADASEDLDDVGKAIEVVSINGQRVVAGTHTILATRYGSVPIVGFGGHLFQSAAVRAGIQREAQGAKVYGISANRISTVVLPLPPTKAEQDKIAKCLGSLERLITAEGRKLAALRDHKRGLMQKLIPQPGETQPCLRFPEFRDKGEWEEEKLSQHITLVSGMHLSPNEYSDRGEMPYFTGPSDFTNSKSHISKWTAHTNNKGVAGDVLITVKGSGVGELWYLELSQAALGRQLMAIRPLNGVSRFYFQLLLSKRRLFEDLAMGNLIPGLSRGDILNLKTPLPKKEEQQKIADCLTALDAQITAQGAKIDVLEQHKRGLMQQLFPAPEEP